MEKYSNEISIIFAILGFSFVIIIHEFGHFMVAQLFGLKIPVFSIGFGPAIFKILLGNTYFQLSLIPLGGYVSFDPLSFASQPYIAQFLIIIAGIVANIILAYLLIAYCFATNQFFKNSSTKIHTPLTAFLYTLTHLHQMSIRTFLKGKEDRTFVGPFGIMSGIATSYKKSFCIYLMSIAMLSLNVAFFNILPLPLLDGGKFVQITLEAMFGPQSAWVIFLISIFLFFMVITFMGWLQSIYLSKKSDDLLND